MIAAAVVVGVLIVVAAAVAASAYVSGKRPTAATAAEAQPSGPLSSASATPAPSSDQPSTPAPSIPGTDGLGFLGTPARCAEGDAARMMVLTATSQAVVCSRGDALYYSGWRTDTGSGTRIEGVLPAGPGWVARAPDATINITPAGLVISTSSGEFAEPATGFWAAP
ncbi:hypothetical protein [Tsukamurella ocularis]|uniref:hypothetical protein n=1 Tax=Tsukamurella ocularis TaxID=1970234 RepID=UPI00216A4849|nr:hypothetical protein [Tsukamurella ocularis]MCS3778367.1 hypothetical protein [Tsukamurella ocularis]MCS3789068.1 hypothetical protein [Tsukamurella ocularis]MCS3852919.1 hypothetical protein [Tsukamurella ocularis]